MLIGLGVMVVAVPIGLAGALLLMQLGPAVRPWYYTTVVAPILVPGVVLGISTLIFWDRTRVMFGASTDSFFYNGFFLTIIGQSTFISAYAMLVFIARLQRFDPALEEAALDLGATHVQAFRKVLLPFLKPAIGSAAVLAFLASFENYNTTVFTIVSEIDADDGAGEQGALRHQPVDQRAGHHDCRHHTGRRLHRGDSAPPQGRRRKGRGPGSGQRRERNRHVHRQPKMRSSPPSHRCSAHVWLTPSRARPWPCLPSYS